MADGSVDATADFMETIGMRRIFRKKDFAVLEMRGGTHLVVTEDLESDLISGNFDLMVEDLDGTHREFVQLGLNPSKIRRGEIHDEFDVREPGGTVILFNSTHVGDLPV